MQRRMECLTLAAWLAAAAVWGGVARAGAEGPDEVGPSRGVCAVLGLPEGEGPGFAARLAEGTEVLVYFQSPDPAETLAVREAAAAAGLLGTRVFADTGAPGRIHLADNLAGSVVLSRAAEARVSEGELLRVLHPGGHATVGGRRIEKQFPEGVDDWTHWYHGPDNNPLSRDALARAPYRTQFLAEPMFCPMPEVTVSAAGRVFKAFGHMAFRADQIPWLNTLICINGFNGAILWRRPLGETFMMHRSCMVAQADALYVADGESCSLHDVRTGQVLRQITVPEGLSDGPVWKWMALDGGRLYALVGGEEPGPEVLRNDRPGLGHWSWSEAEKIAYDYEDSRRNYGFGRTFLAVEPGSGTVLWHHREEGYIDSRGVCMGGERIYYYIPNRALGCLDARTGKALWRSEDPDLLAAINVRPIRQSPREGFATEPYVKCSEDMLFFAGQQRTGVVAVSGRDGRLLWRFDERIEYPHYHLVLGDEVLYATATYPGGWTLDYETGSKGTRVPSRWNCTRVTGSVDSLFSRGAWGAGTWRYDLDGGQTEFISPMRPGCQDGVVIANGMLYWGPWVCGACNISLYGHICLAPSDEPEASSGMDSPRLARGEGVTANVAELDVHPDDWPAHGGAPGRLPVTNAAITSAPVEGWSFEKASGRVTAPVAAGGIVFFGDERGVLRALDARTGGPVWQAYAGGAILCPPALWQGRLYAGAADGRVYAFEAATGRLLWSFLAAPRERWIPVYGKLCSTWPVAGGVAVNGGTLYAAAGIADYDGTHVYALDAVTGEVKWHNGGSGHLLGARGRCKTGVSLQGPLYVEDERLCFDGGTVYDTAAYDLATGDCLNDPQARAMANNRTVFEAYYERYEPYVPVRHTFPDGRTLQLHPSWWRGLALLAPFAPGVKPPEKASQRPNREVLWSKPLEACQGCVLAPEAVLVAGETRGERAPVLCAVRLEDGADLWTRQLAAPPVKNGLAVDRTGRIIVSLRDGRVVCFPGAQRAQ